MYWPETEKGEAHCSDEDMSVREGRSKGGLTALGVGIGRDDLVALAV